MTLLSLVALCCRLALSAGLSPFTSSQTAQPPLVAVCLESSAHATPDRAAAPLAAHHGVLGAAAQVWPFSAVVRTAHGTLDDFRSAWQAVAGPATKQTAQCPLKAPTGERFLRRMCT